MAELQKTLTNRALEVESLKLWIAKLRTKRIHLSPMHISKRKFAGPGRAPALPKTAGLLSVFEFDGNPYEKRSAWLGVNC